MQNNDNIIEGGEIIKCPFCRRTLFVKSKEVAGDISIKCSRCKNIYKINLKKS